MDIFSKKQKKISTNNVNPVTSLPEVIEQLAKSKDFKQSKAINELTNTSFQVSFISTLIDNKIIQKDLMPYLLYGKFHTLKDLKYLIPSRECHISSDPADIEEKLMTGCMMIRIDPNDKTVALLPAAAEVGREISPSEVEFTVGGPKESFVEAIEKNLNLIRIRLPIKELVIDEVLVGTLTKTRVAIIYIDGLTRMQDVNTITQRIKDIHFDQIQDSSFIEEMIADNKNSPFPQLLNSERPLKVITSLTEGKVAAIVDGSPFAIMGPSSIMSFFSSAEDYLMNWIVASFIRLLRIIGVVGSIFATPMYVAILTYHPQIIPKDLLPALISSRQHVPFPPFLEALFLEITIELLREAGARLPTKVGQTIGIVGGIVLGTASVEAGLTSNVLLILVSIAALASFTTPVYKISTTIRLIRFPFLLSAQLWGFLGIAVNSCIILAHLIQLKSLGRPYLEPLYPPRLTDLKDSFIRFPFYYERLRPGYLQSEKPVRFQSKKPKKYKDIDE
ncbi:spore germination protein [Bacillus sp. FJAT-49732]|uniref:Spore germination protein n=1 Tax=Lederbergia citrisecunda TaxID=2833583 RepID=A0A942YKB4_9BACI|nr:spore germination protein [Lederbergia citrisecunda]MBS4200208.1 spore germination protein [Lederbergia citrisecunda]